MLPKCGQMSVLVGLILTRPLHSLNLAAVALSVGYNTRHPLYKRVSQIRAGLVAHREPDGVQNRLPNGLYVFEHKT